MIRRPPRSTLFPTRRSSDLTVVGGGAHRTLFAVFLGVALSISALPVIAKTLLDQEHGDRKSTRLNSSHSSISYAVFCLKKKKKKKKNTTRASDVTCESSIRD